MNQQNIKQQHPQNKQEEIINHNLQALNQQYASKITEGEIELTMSRNKEKLSPAEKYDRKEKERKIAQAEKEKEELQKKLEFIDKSIQSIKNYDYSTGKITQHYSPPASPSPTNLQDIIKQNQLFHQKLRQDRKRLSEKKQLQRQRHEQKQKQLQQQKQKQTQQQKTKRKQQIYQNLQKIKERIENRQSQLKFQQEQYQKVISRTTLFQKIEKQQQETELTLLEERKKKLANIRNLHQPLKPQELEEHQRRFIQALQEKQSMRERERKINNATEAYSVSYKSPHHQRYSLEHSFQDQIESKAKADKVKQFSEHVRENFAPQIDEKKKDDLEKKIEEQLQKQHRKAIKQEEDRQRVEDIKNKGLRYLQQMRELPKKKQNQSQISPQTERPRYTNYLTHSQHRDTGKWTSILDSKATKKEKALKLQLQAEKMENSLKMKEQKARVLKNDPDAVDEQYYEMIKAKLELLQI